MLSLLQCKLDLFITYIYTCTCLQMRAHGDQRLTSCLILRFSPYCCLNSLSLVWNLSSKTERLLAMEPQGAACHGLSRVETTSMCHHACLYVGFVTQTSIFMLMQQALYQTRYLSSLFNILFKSSNGLLTLSC